jgi:hypothetical protein
MDPRDDIKAKRREFKRKYRERHRTYSVSFRKDDADELETKAAELNLDVPEFIKSLISTSRGNAGYIVPAESRIQELLLALRRIGNNINQLVRYCHSTRAMGHSEVERLTEYLAEIESVVKEALTKPPRIETLVDQEVQKHPWLKQVLLTILESHRL